MSMPYWEIPLFFFIIAFVYASVGFGGGSSYLAILAMYALPYREVRLIALLCNIIVVTGGVLIFIRRRQITWKRILPIVLLSVPMAFWGATMKLSQHHFYILLGCSLITAAAVLWIRTKPGLSESEIPATQGNTAGWLAGGAVGFLSGLVGIGGGIFLAPLLNLLKWDTAKRIAATASVFILVNSLAGIAGQISQWPPAMNYTLISSLGIAVLAGGQLGSRIGVLRFNPFIIRRLTAVLVFIAGLEVLIKHLR